MNSLGIDDGFNQRSHKLMIPAFSDCITACMWRQKVFNNDSANFINSISAFICWCIHWRRSNFVCQVQVSIFISE